MKPAVVAGPTPDELRFAIALDHLLPERELEAEVVAREAMGLVMGMDGHLDARFVLQLHALPDPKAPEAGELRVHLLTTLTGADGTPPSDDRLVELSDDLVDILGAPPRRGGFSLVDDEAALGGTLAPLDPVHLAEIARREEPCTPLRWMTRTETFGFDPKRWSTPPAPDPAPGKGGQRSDEDRRRWDVLDRSLWSMWTFGPPAERLHRLASALLAQEAPVCVRVVLQPTALTDDERVGIEELVMSSVMTVPEAGLLRASVATLEALVYLRPLFEVRCLVASPERISRSLLSTIGQTISSPSPHHDLSASTLHGGFAVVRGDVDVESSVLRDAYVTLGLGDPIPSLAPPGLERLRRLLGPWEASMAFRLPTTDDDFPGIPTIDTPELDPPLADLATSGRRMGFLAGHGARPVLLDPEERFRHLYVVGQTGTGKSTMLFNLALQDIAAGAGVAVLDPHGDLVEALLRNIPDDRLDDVVLIDPADTEAVVGVNLLEAETPVQKEYVVTELCNMFYELFDPHRQGIIGPRYETMLRQSALLLLAHPEQPSSMLDMSTLFVDQAVRKHLVEGVTDPILAEFWLGEMSMARSNEWQEVVSWFRSKFEIFRTSRLVRNVVGQAESTVSFADVLQERRILLVNLSKGLLGSYNSSLIGHIVFTRLWAAALERASMAEADRSDFFFYIDEFQNMTSESLPDVLSEARKFRVGMTLANQFLSQVPVRTRDAIMGNVGNRVTFRLGPNDAELSALWMGRELKSHDLVTLPNHTAVASLSERGVPLDPLVLHTDAPNDAGDLKRAEVARQRSRERWARPVDQLDGAFFSRWRHVQGSVAAQTAGAVKPPPPERASFLDEWLSKRRTATQVTLRVTGDPTSNVIAIIKLLRSAVPGLSPGDAKALVDRTPDGAEVIGVDRESVPSLVDDLEALGLTVVVHSDDPAP